MAVEEVKVSQKLETKKQVQVQKLTLKQVQQEK